MAELTWELFHQQVESCAMCPLHGGIRHKVPGQGDVHAPLMFIGEGPGQVEDEEGLAFVGPAGQLLTKMLAAISLPRDRVYICNIVKCRPPQNRDPQPDEAAACLNYLRAQVALVRPRVVVLLGKVACQYTLNEQIFITRDHGQWRERKGTWFMPTFHPSALLRDPAKKRDAWEDLQAVQAKLRELGLYADLLDQNGAT